MGGVDRFDQRRELYSVSRRSRRWWLRIFYFTLDASLVNAYALYNSIHPDDPMTQLEFRSRIFRGLVGNYCSRRRRASVDVNFLQSRRHSADRKRKGVPDEIRLDRVGIHFPKQVAKFSRCRVCSTKTHCKRSRVQCNVCCVPLCTDPCFRKFHHVAKLILSTCACPHLCRHSKLYCVFRVSDSCQTILSVWPNKQIIIACLVGSGHIMSTISTVLVGGGQYMST